MILQVLEVGPLLANCYLLGCEATGRGAIIDPGGDADVIVAAAKKAGLEVDWIIDTHAHPDHISANCEVREALSAVQETAPSLAIHADDRAAVEAPPMEWLLMNMRPEPCPVDESLAEGSQLQIGELVATVMSTPGHTPGGITVVVDGVAFTGDTLFAGGIGRTDFPGGDYATIMQSLKRLVTELPPDTVVYPGHGPNSTIRVERDTNEWLADLA